MHFQNVLGHAHWSRHEFGAPGEWIQCSFSGGSRRDNPPFKPCHRAPSDLQLYHTQRCKSGSVKKSENLQLMPNYMGVQIHAWSSLCLESEEWSRFTVK